MASKDELACTYSALILADDDVPITADKMNTILKAANCKVEPFWPTLYAKALSSISVKDLITSVGSTPAGGGAAAPASASTTEAAPVVAEAKEEKKESEDESEDDDMGFGLFD